jgi:poly-beta-hydroxyalkanoate depolymerase
MLSIVILNNDVINKTMYFYPQYQSIQFTAASYFYLIRINKTFMQHKFTSDFLRKSLIGHI